MQTFEELLIFIGQTTVTTWWVVLLIPILFIFRDWWLLRIRREFIGAMEWSLVEVKIPRENLKTPKAMEQVFASLHASYSFGLKRIDRWWFGKVEEWMSIEMVGTASRVHFYARFLTKYRNLVETAIFSQYPDAEIQDAEDYTTQFGDEVPNDTYDLFGTDFMLAKDQAYPIRTYPFFEEIAEERRLDPISTIAEVMSSLKSDETIWIQILIRATGDHWKESAEEIVNKIMGRKKPAPSPGLMGELAIFMRNLSIAIFQPPEWPGGSEEKPAPPQRFSPGEEEILRAVENKVSKLSFDSIVRFIYIDKKDAFTSSNVAAVMGAMRQFSTQHLNAFRPNVGTLTVPRAIGLFFRKPRMLKRKKKLFKTYRERIMPVEPRRIFALRLTTSVLSTEELATVFHPPITAVGAQRLRRLETRKGGPPGSLPIIERG